MKITHTKLTPPAAIRGKRLVTICAELGGPNEFMTITVAVPNDDKEFDVCECGIARAKDYARQFADAPLEHFPPAR
jgi:hypothetical protein